MTTSAFIAAILGKQGPIGTGFLVSHGAVFSQAAVVTCGHVVNQALGRATTVVEPPEPATRITMRFPFASTKTTIRGEVVVWHPLLQQHGGSSLEDIAVLALGDPVPEGMRPAKLDPDPLPIGRHVRTTGFAAGYPNGQDAAGRIISNDAAGWLTICSGPDELPFTSGHSGTPVLGDDNNRVLGMTSLVDERRRDLGIVIPSGTLGTAWLPLARPFRGLERFDATTAHLFKGRETETATLTTLIRRERAAIIVGSSGSGKSSLIRAGLLPALDKRWRCLVVEPARIHAGNSSAASRRLAPRTYG